MRGNTLIAMRLIIVVIMRGSGAVAIRGFELLLQCAGAVLFSCAGSRLLLCVGAVLPPLPPPAAGLPPEVFPLLATSSPSPIDEVGHGWGSLEPVEAELSLLRHERACGSFTAAKSLYPL
jgi:hypothetical protein